MPLSFDMGSKNKPQPQQQPQPKTTVVPPQPGVTPREAGPESAGDITSRANDSWWDVVPRTAGYGQPSRAGPQSWFDWFSKNYTPTPADAAKVAADAWGYHMWPLALQGVQALNKAGLGTAAPTPTGETPQLLRNQIQGAYDRMGPAGPIAQAVGYATSPLTYAGIGPIGRLLGKGAEAVLPAASKVAEKALPQAAAKYVPENFFPNMAEGGNFAGSTAALHTAGEGGSPTDIAESYGTNFPIGAGIAGGVGVLPLGRRTPAEVTRSTQQALDAQNVTIPRKNLGFTMDAGPGAWRGDPTLADIEELKKMLQTEAQAKGYTPTNLSRSAYDVPDPTADMERRGALGAAPSGGAEVGSPELQQQVRPPSAAGGTIQDILLGKISKALPQSLDANYQLKLQQAQNAQMLESMRSNAGLPGFDVRRQAADAAQNYPAGSSENTAFQNIARVPDAVPKTVTPGVRRAMIYGGGALGEGGGWLGGIPGGGAGGSFVGNEAANAIDWAFSPRSPTHAIQQTIDQQYPALAGQGVGPGGNQALFNALLYLRGPGTGSQ